MSAPLPVKSTAIPCNPVAGIIQLLRWIRQGDTEEDTGGAGQG